MSHLRINGINKVSLDELRDLLLGDPRKQAAMRVEKSDHPARYA